MSVLVTASVDGADSYYMFHLILICQVTQESNIHFKATVIAASCILEVVDTTTMTIQQHCDLFFESEVTR